MPTYEYRCKSCGQHLEVVQSFADDPLTECPGCGGELRKVFGAIGIVFKGNGFYKTDSRSTAKAGSSNGSAEAKPDKSDKSEKSDSKTGSKSESSSTSSSSSSDSSSSSSSRSEAKSA